MVTNPVTGAGYVLQGMRLITRPGIRRFVIVPLAINILVFIGAIAFAVTRFEHLLGWMQAQIPSWLQWMEWLLWPLFILLLLVIVFYTFNLIANLIASPFNGLLAEKVELMLTNQPIDSGGGYRQMLAELLPTLLEEAAKLLYTLALAIPFLVLLFVPVIGPFLWFLYTAWILVVEYSDYPMGNHGLKFREIRQRLHQKRTLSLGFGATVAGLGMVPGLNFILMPSAVAGATLMWVREFRATPASNHYQGPNQSRVATRWVMLVIDHLSGRITGEILRGPLQGQALEQLSTEELQGVLSTCYRNDPESAEALEVFLSRERGLHFQEPPPRERSERETTHQPSRTPEMQTDVARAILGITAEAGPEEIRSAHRRLIQRLHPDRGGSAYLAARINEARDLLLR